MSIEKIDRIERSEYKVVIIGAGLSGLMAGLNLQKKGIKTIILEKRNTPGGLCGTKVIDGYEFSIACNDFGAGFKKELEKLGISYIFLKANTVFCFDHAKYHIPAKVSTLFKLLPHTADVIRFIKGLKNTKYKHLEELLNDRIKSLEFKDTLSMLAYALAIPPHDVRIQSVKEGFSKEFNYGYEKPVIPEGGPKKFIDELVRKYKEMGGVLNYEEEFINVETVKFENDKGFKKIVSSKDTYYSKFLISSQARWNKYPVDLKETVPISIVYLVLKKSFKFPENITTIACLPKNVSFWMTEIDEGRLPEEFGFHITKPDIIHPSNYYTVNINFLSPRNFEWNSKAIQKAMNYLLVKIDILLPGIYQSILYKKFISPNEFTQLHSLSSQNFKYVLQEGFNKPDIYDPDNDIYYIGNSVSPPGEHVGGAILSALNASNQLINQL